MNILASSHAIVLINVCHRTVFMLEQKVTLYNTVLDSPAGDSLSFSMLHALRVAKEELWYSAEHSAAY